MKGAGRGPRAGENIVIRHVERLDFTVTEAPWPFAEERRAEIDAHFVALKKEKPALWNGRVLLFRDCVFTDDALTGGAFETDYASFMAWRAWNYPDNDIRNCFALPALESGDGAFLLGRMASHTANAGQIYFPCGTPDPNDIVSGRADLDGSARRELLEETGLDADTLVASSGWDIACDGGMVALFKRMKSDLPALRIQSLMLDFLAAQDTPELSDIVIVRSADDLSPDMPPYVIAFLQHALSARVTE